MFSERHLFHRLDHWAWMPMSWWFGIWGVCLRARLLTLLCKLPGKREQVTEHSHLHFFFLPMGTDFCSKDCRSPITWKSRIFVPMFPGFTQGTLCLYLLITEHSHVGLFLLIMRWGVHNCHRKTICTCLSLLTRLQIDQTMWVGHYIQKWMFPIILLWSRMVEFLFCFGLDFSWFCCSVGLLRFLGGFFPLFFLNILHLFPAVRVCVCVCAFVVVLACLKWMVRERLGMERTRFYRLVNREALAKVLLTCMEWSLSCTC